jgi:dTDP-4-dehydrorhamnose 3,5-epimerase
MTLRELSISGSYLVAHKVFPDDRGIFREWFRSEEMVAIDNNFSVKQANFSKSKKNVIRGIHYSLAPSGQAKVVTCASGEIVDVLVDLRTGSPTYLNIEYIKLSEESGSVAYIPSGVGHGFFVESESASVVYLTSSTYSPEYEKAICPIDPDLAIKWPIPQGEIAIISGADQNAQKLMQAIESNQLPKWS